MTHCAKNQTTIQFHRTNVLAFLRDNILYLKSQIGKTVFKIGLYMSSQYSLFQPFMLGISRIKGFVTELPPPSLPALPSNIICTLFEGYIFTIGEQYWFAHDWYPIYKVKNYPEKNPRLEHDEIIKSCNHNTFHV